MITYEIPCLLGLEKLVADEIKRLGLADVRAENGRVLCQGSWADCARLNINLRCGARVIALLGQFPARSFEELFQGVRAIPWEEFLPREAAFPVKGYSISSQLHSVPACQSIIKKAVVERLKAHYGMDQFPETGTKYQIRFSVFKDQVSIGLDASGEGLYKRGYRAVGVEAPLRETLAAALVTLSRYRGRDPFCDPFCGSGTIPIEAALIAKNRAPGLDRRFAAVPVDACYASDLYRTCATASAIYKPKGLPLHTDPNLRQVNMGVWEGHAWQQLRMEDEERIVDFNRHLDRWQVPGGETAQQVLDRFIPALTKIALENDGKTVAVFSHGMALRTVLGVLQGQTLAQVGQHAPWGQHGYLFGGV